MTDFDLDTMPPSGADTRTLARMEKVLRDAGLEFIRVGDTRRTRGGTLRDS